MAQKLIDSMPRRIAEVLKKKGQQLWTLCVKLTLWFIKSFDTYEMRVVIFYHSNILQKDLRALKPQTVKNNHPQNLWS